MLYYNGLTVLPVKYKEMESHARGLIIFLLFNKYLGILSVLESKRHLTYAGHLTALMGNSLLYQFCAHPSCTVSDDSQASFTSIKDANGSSCRNRLRRTGKLTSKDNW